MTGALAHDPFGYRLDPGHGSQTAPGYGVGRHSRRHGRSVTSVSPKRCPVAAHSTAVANSTAAPVIVGDSVDTSQSVGHSTGHGVCGPKLALMPAYFLVSRYWVPRRPAPGPGT